MQPAKLMGFAWKHKNSRTFEKEQKKNSNTGKIIYYPFIPENKFNIILAQEKTPNPISSSPDEAYTPFG